MTKKTSDDLVDAGSAYSFPASDPPSFMGGTAVIGPPPENGAHEHVIEELTDPGEAQPAAPPHGAHASGGAVEDDIGERIRRRAYEIWETEGYSGNADAHWLRAEQEVRASMQTAQDQQAEAGAAPSEDAEKMAEQIQVALDARNARSKQSQRAGATGKKPAAKKGSSRKGKPPSST